MAGRTRLVRGEAELADQIRHALGDDRFGQAFAAGSWLSQQEAVAAIRDQPAHGIPVVLTRGRQHR